MNSRYHERYEQDPYRAAYNPEFLAKVDAKRKQPSFETRWKELRKLEEVQDKFDNQSIKAILEDVADRHRIDKTRIVNNTRGKDVTRARNELVARIAMARPDMSWGSLARLLGGTINANTLLVIAKKQGIRKAA